MSELTIKTNNVPRNLIYGCDLSAKEKEEFDYIKPEDFDTHDFFRYKGQIYDPSEFTRIEIMTDERSSPYCCPVPKNDILSKWRGIMSQSVFHGILIRYTPDYSQIIVGSYFC